MDETIDVAQTNDHTETDRPISEKDFQQLLDEAVDTTRDVQVDDVTTAEFTCSQAGANRYEFELAHPDLSFNINLRKAFSQDAAVEFVENHSNNDHVYATIIVLSHAGQKNAYLADVSHSIGETRAVAAQAEAQSGDDGMMPVTFEGDIDTIRFGREETLRSSLPSSLNPQSIRPAVSNNKALAIMSVLVFFAWLLPGTGIVPLVVGLGSYYLSKGTYRASHIDIDASVLLDEGSLQTEVWDCEIRHQNDQVVIQRENGTEMWRFEKNNAGELRDRGKKAMQQIKTVDGAGSCIVPVQKTRIADTAHVRSESGEYSIVDKTDW